VRQGYGHKFAMISTVVTIDKKIGYGSSNATSGENNILPMSAANVIFFLLHSRKTLLAFWHY
jgi:hypothetical protein